MGGHAALLQRDPRSPFSTLLRFLLARSDFLVVALSCLEMGGNYNSKRLKERSAKVKISSRDSALPGLL